MQNRFVRPKKHLGQHFLTDRNIASRITEYIKPSDYTKLIEIGPGKGVLTGFLFERKDIDLVCVEIDQEAIDYLYAQWPERKDVIIKADFLNLNLLEDFGNKFGIIGNFPYNISSQIFFKALECKDNCREIVCMLQKEVAERIISPPGNKTYGILSVLLQTWYNMEYLFTVNPGSFFPAPEVKSAVIRMVRNDRKELPVSDKFFKQFVKTAFNQRRKMLRNSIKMYLGPDTPDHPMLTKRPEQLSVDEFLELAVFIEKNKQ